MTATQDFIECALSHIALQERVGRALALINSYGGIEGNHHKTWVIDQVVRILCTTDRKYQKWVKKHQRGEDGPETYSWEIGIAP